MKTYRTMLRSHRKPFAIAASLFLLFCALLLIGVDDAFLRLIVYSGLAILSIGVSFGVISAGVSHITPSHLRAFAFFLLIVIAGVLLAVSGARGAMFAFILSLPPIPFDEPFRSIGTFLSD